MSYVNYNGVQMELVKTNGVERIPIFSSDKTTYLYTQWTHDFVAVLNPAATAYDAAGNAAANQLPIVTDKAIRHKLSQGHATYEWYVGERGVLADRVIRSPAPAAKTDMNNGPHPEVVSVVQVTGTHTWMVHMRITTWINECPTTPLILSHRWRQEADYNSDHFATRTTTGEVIFNPVRLAAGAIAGVPLMCDDLRIRLRHPVPAHFQRTGIRVVQGEDGVTVNYVFIDNERPMNFNTPGQYVTNIEVTRSVTTVGANAFQFVTQGVAAAASSLYQSSANNLANERFGHGEARRGINAYVSSAQMRLGGAAGIIAGLGAVLPSLAVRVKVAVHGNRLSSKNRLFKIALGILWERTQNIRIGLAPRAQIDAAFDDMGKYVEITGMYHADMITLIQRAAFGPGAYPWGVSLDPVRVCDPGGVPVHAVEYAMRDSLASYPENIATPQASISNDAAVINNQFPYSEGTRGTWVERLVTQALSQTCAEPPADDAAPIQAADLEIDPFALGL